MSNPRLFTLTRQRVGVLCAPIAVSASGSSAMSSPARRCVAPSAAIQFQEK
jgi:hypothetical protein